MVTPGRRRVAVMAEREMSGGDVAEGETTVGIREGMVAGPRPLATGSGDWMPRGRRPGRTVAIVGSTGSIGRQALEVVAAAGERFSVEFLGAGSSVELLAEQAAAVRPRAVGIGRAELAGELARRLPPGIEVLAGVDGLVEGASRAETVLNAVVGFAGLSVTIGALRSGRRLALANKESLVAGGPVVKAAAETPGSELVPVDSEHCALHQCLRGGRLGEVAALVVTASGGPFRGRRPEELARVTPEDALAHPTWQMGPKITVDSSTLMNKGLEVIEAHELFDLPYDRISVVVHPQSIVHSMVTFSDGATLAQLSLPDMRLPIGYALGWPERLEVPFGAIDWSTLARLDFSLPDRATFRALDLAYAAGVAGKGAPACLNAANEVAVAAFLAGRISWLDIAAVVEETLAHHDPIELDSIEEVLAVDRAGRRQAEEAVRRRGR